MVVFSDVRFENEAQMIRSTGGTIVHIERSGAEAVSAHASEQGVAQQSDDLRFDNSGALGAMQDYLSHWIT
ncbi:hypothetical protein [Luteibacter sp. 9135]|uniref:deoxynucleotide monophosphate kinase family protein n=1 Tax=Luteibacter sp. 9135 TaxID=1500893 RepID=UPI003F8A5EC7